MNRPTSNPHWFVTTFASVARTALSMVALSQLTTIWAQTTVQRPSASGPVFEVTSVKSSRTFNGSLGFQFQPGGRFTATYVTVRSVIALAYNVKEFQVLEGPAWLDTQRYDIVAKTEEGTGAGSREMMLARVQALLTERFKMKFRRETKELPVYTLLVAKSGPKLKEEETSANGAALSIDGNGFTFGRGRITGRAVTIAMLANILSNQLGRPVIDKTSLKQEYDFQLDWMPDQSQLNGPLGRQSPPQRSSEEAQAADASRADSDKPDLFKAVQDQLGLTLQSQKAPVEVLVIERVEEPSEN